MALLYFSCNKNLRFYDLIVIYNQFFHMVEKVVININIIQKLEITVFIVH